MTKTHAKTRLKNEYDSYPGDKKDYIQIMNEYMGELLQEQHSEEQKHVDQQWKWLEEGEKKAKHAAEKAKGKAKAQQQVKLDVVEEAETTKPLWLPTGTPIWTPVWSPIKCEPDSIDDVDFVDGDKKALDQWEEYPTNVGHTDDYHKLPKNTHIDEVKAKCKELGSRAFVYKVNCQCYIRSPPSVKQFRDYNSLKARAEYRVSRGHHDGGYKTYLLNY